MLSCYSLFLGTAFSQVVNYFDCIKYLKVLSQEKLCIEWKKNKHEVKGFRVLEVVLVSVEITYPFHQTEISCLFKDF